MPTITVTDDDKRTIVTALRDHAAGLQVSASGRSNEKQSEEMCVRAAQAQTLANAIERSST